jgi:hypothetical protein
MTPDSKDATSSSSLPVGAKEEGLRATEAQFVRSMLWARYDDARRVAPDAHPDEVRSALSSDFALNDIAEWKDLDERFRSGQAVGCINVMSSLRSRLTYCWL